MKWKTVPQFWACICNTSVSSTCGLCSIGVCVCVCMYVMTEVTAVPNRPVRSASDDQLLSHSEAFDSIAIDSRLRCDSNDLTKSDDIETMRQPTCSHDVPENCSASCWTFANYTGAVEQQCSGLQPCDMSKTESWPCMNEKLPMTKSKSTEHCYLDDADVADYAPVIQAACLHPASL